MTLIASIIGLYLLYWFARFGYDLCRAIQENT